LVKDKRFAQDGIRSRRMRALCSTNGRYKVKLRRNNDRCETAKRHLVSQHLENALKFSQESGEAVLH